MCLCAYVSHPVQGLHCHTCRPAHTSDEVSPLGRLSPHRHRRCASLLEAGRRGAIKRTAQSFKHVLGATLKAQKSTGPLTGQQQTLLPHAAAMTLHSRSQQVCQTAAWACTAAAEHPEGDVSLRLIFCLHEAEPSRAHVPWVQCTVYTITNSPGRSLPTAGQSKVCAT